MMNNLGIFFVFLPTSRDSSASDRMDNFRKILSKTTSLGLSITPMTLSSYRRSLCTTLIVGLLCLHGAASFADEVAGLEHFEKHIRPLFVEKCIGCHGPDKQKGGLRLDSREAMLIGGDSGPVLEPGMTEDSLLLSVISYSSDLKMPPKERLSSEVVKKVSDWIAMGAPDPRKAVGEIVKRKGIDLEKGREFWAYQPVGKVKIPTVKQNDWPHSELDFFILKELEAKGLKPVTDASQSAWGRRLYYALTGLPPTAQQLNELTSMTSPEDRVRLVDQLLESPRFGERWGRHWLDIARFGESVTLRGLVFQNAWRYRDYVIESFNRDVPLDQFIAEQIGGDLMEADGYEDRRRKMIATSFLTLGNHNLEEQNKESLNMNGVDEQLDTIGKAFLGQTIACARCHDHKFDPIPTADYYAMAGILRSTDFFVHNNVSGWIEESLPLSPEQEKVLNVHKKEVAALKKEIDALKKITGTLSQKRTGAIKVSDLPGVVVDDAGAVKVGDWVNSTFKNLYIGQGYAHDDDKDKGLKSLSFEPELPKEGRYEVLLAYYGHSNRSTKTPITIQSADGEKSMKVNMRNEAPIDGRFLSLGTYRFETNGFSTVLISNKGTDGHVVVDAVIFLPVDDDVKLARPDASDTEATKARARLAKLQSELSGLEKNAPVVPKAMVVRDRDKPADIPIHIRGVVGNHGETVRRGFLQVASIGDPVIAEPKQSGRLEMGRWIGSKDNPLTARVYVNRVWHWLMGQGLVRTVDNFGTTGVPPTHPELLDYLARRFMDNGWSTKSLIRDIILSRTWGLSSKASEMLEQADPENVLLARAHRTRLEAEMMRDAILQISGDLDLTMGGSEFSSSLKADYGFSYSGNRRSIYAPQLRNAPLEILETFDMANSSFTTGDRSSSTVAPQALYLMNHPFVMDQAEKAAGRMLNSVMGRDARLTYAWQSVLGREPSAGERRVMNTFLSENVTDEASEPKAWAQIYQSLFGSIDFRYIP